jgi:hypothetical protein
MAGGTRVRLATLRKSGRPAEAYVGITPAIEGHAINSTWFVSVPKLSCDLALISSIESARVRPAR